MLSDPAHPASDGAAADLGISALAGVLTGAQEGIVMVDPAGSFVYANPAACEMLGLPLEQLRGRNCLDSFATRDHSIVMARWPMEVGDAPAPFTCALIKPDGSELEVVWSPFAVDIGGRAYGAATFREPATAARITAALAQTAKQLVGTASTSEILAGIARHAVEGTRALVCGIPVVDSNHEVASVGSYLSPTHGLSASSATTRNSAWDTFAGVPGEAVIHAMTAGSIIIGEPPGEPLVRADVRDVWEANPVTRGFAASMETIAWQAGVFVPLSSEDRVFGAFGILLPAGLSGPSDSELAFYTTLADQAAVAVTNARLSSQAAQAAAQLERTRLARDLHDSVSQALFSMTMHARAAQLAMASTGLDETGPLGRSILELAGLTRGAMAEMRALIFELRPSALVEEGLVAALRKQGAALTAREQVVITVDGPDQRLELSASVEEHLYRIVSEALHNVVKHARAETATVSIRSQAEVLRVQVSDDGIGFDTNTARPGHLGLGTMADRAATIGADLVLKSVPGAGTTATVSIAHGATNGGDGFDAA